ncbi:hypothetical protein LguiB_001616 [Lonicera macranthoides]
MGLPLITYPIGSSSSCRHLHGGGNNMSLSDLSWELYRLSIFVATLTGLYILREQICHDVSAKEAIDDDMKRRMKGTSQLSRERRSSKERNLIKRKESRSKRKERQEEFFTKTRRVLYNEASELIYLQAQQLFTFVNTLEVGLVPETIITANVSIINNARVKFNGLPMQTLMSIAKVNMGGFIITPYNDILYWS